MTVPEFSRRYPLDTLGTAPRTVEIAADATERAALARRFGVARIDALAADAVLAAVAGGAEARGHVRAEIVQACIVTGDPVPAHIDEPFVLRFLDAVGCDGADEELELSDADCDIVPLDGGAVDLGEAVAQSFALALDPFPRSDGAGAETGRTWSAGPDAGPFAALKGLK